MKSHVWRPLYVALCVVALILIVRVVVVPKDFGIHESGYMYGWYRKSNEEFWKGVKVKYKTTSYCKECHADNYTSIQQSAHGIIPCEDCHGPGTEHPGGPSNLHIDTRRQLCLRCHARLPYPTSGRNDIRGINPDTHNPEAECTLCHNPHNPSLTELKR